jgi:hypothetical protein
VYGGIVEENREARKTLRGKIFGSLRHFHQKRFRRSDK